MDCSSYNHLLRLTPYELHKKLINHYVLTKKGATALLNRDSSRDKRDIDVIRENHRFLWNDGSEPDTWEERLARKYYDKLFKEYCICDLIYYKENKVAMRWQTEQELITGKGQFVCGEKRCRNADNLKTWEVNFGYIEHGEKKNALVKLRLCSDCSVKLNYKHKRKEIKRKRLKKLDGKHSIKSGSKIRNEVNNGTSCTEGEDKGESEDLEAENNVWKETNANLDEPSRDEEFEEYLEHLLL
ncbi:protein FRA10AC1 homolog [Lycorma delicatula]|uniref:protein FRA10AC1 homolog n=1 Tax=Lycorma delicatula TaxID=130591 RepID=UPI003F518D02